MFLCGVAITLCGFGFLAIVLGGDLDYFLDFYSLIPILFSLLAVLTATKSFKVFYKGLRAAIFPKEDVSEETRVRTISLFRLLSKTTIMASAIGMLICLINVLMNLDFSDAGGVSLLGINIAASLTMPIYAMLLIIVVFEPAVFILKKRSHN